MLDDSMPKDLLDYSRTLFAPEDATLRELTLAAHAFGMPVGWEITPDVGHHFTIAPNLVGPNPIENLLLDVNELVSIQILKGEFVAQARKFSLDLKCVVAVDVLDRKVVAEGDELLLQYVLHISLLVVRRGILCRASISSSISLFERRISVRASIPAPGPSTAKAHWSPLAKADGRVGEPP